MSMSKEDAELIAMLYKKFNGEYLAADRKLSDAILAITQELFKTMPSALAIPMLADLLAQKAVLITAYPALQLRRTEAEQLIDVAASQAFKRLTYVDDPVSK